MSTIRNTVTLLKAVETAQSSNPYQLQGSKQVIHAFIEEDTGADHAVVTVEATNDLRAASLATADDAAWEPIGTLTIGSLSSDSEGQSHHLVNEDPWAFIRVTVDSVAYAAVTVSMVDQG